MTSYLGEVTTTGDGGKFATNALRFATEEEAQRYVDDLAFRWTAVVDARTAESADPVNYRWDDEIQRAVCLAATEIVHVTAA